MFDHMHTQPIHSDAQCGTVLGPTQRFIGKIASRPPANVYVRRLALVCVDSR